jgi:error-prone DNA polymerase
MTRYVELQVTTNFSFLRGASHPDELVATAAAHGTQAIAVTDRNTLAGIVRMHVAAKRMGLRLVVGARLDLQDGPSLLCFPTDRAAYGRLCRVLTIGKRRAEKGHCTLYADDLPPFLDGQALVVLPPLQPVPDASFAEHLQRYAQWGAWLAATWRWDGQDGRRLQALAELAERCGTPLVATNDVRYHVPERRVLQDVLTCVRTHCTVAEAGGRLASHAERYLKSPEEMARLFARLPGAVERSLAIVERCRFSLDELRYEYPDEPVPPGLTPQQHLMALTEAGARRRYPYGLPPKIRKQLDHEYALIEERDFARYFLTVHDIVAFARSKGILAQGRGSAANSTVCYCLEITAIDPARMDLLFERFISTARNEPPDIDVDFEHERREEVIQYIYERYGRERAGLAATVIRYRSRSAIRDVGKALGLSLDTVAALARNGWGHAGLEAQEVRELGLDPAEPTLALAIQLTTEMIDFPRHLSQHVGGFVMTRGRLDEVVPIENAAMDERTVIEWEKNDLEALRMLKVDVLALGMLTCIRKAFELLVRHGRGHYALASVPEEDAKVYAMLSRADTIGVFQVESRAQMTILPRLKPKTFYDLVIEVAIVRPGPIQGDMVHPYLRRRDGTEPVEYPSEALRQVLEKTLGVPLFQEQAMKIAIVAADFTPAEADELRRAMATFRNNGTIHLFERKLIDGMVANGYAEEFARRCYQQIQGFGEYGFPESHAASFALLAYVSAWLKCHHPAVFTCALLNSQPMGFYAASQLVRDARDHGVKVLAPDINLSEWDCTLEPDGAGLAIRLGLRQIDGLPEAALQQLFALRGNGYGDVRALWRRTSLRRRHLERLAEADAFRSIELDRRQALWAVKALDVDAAPERLPLFAAADRALPEEPEVALPGMHLGEHVLEDYRTLGLSLKAHPLALLRERLRRLGYRPHGELKAARNGVRFRTAGIVVVRQRPGTASGVIFMTLEDETGIANIVVWPKMFARRRRVVLTARLIGVIGKVQSESNVIHVVADELLDLSEHLGALTAPVAHADGVTHPGDDGRVSRKEQRRTLFPSRDFH